MKLLTLFKSLTNVEQRYIENDLSSIKVDGKFVKINIESIKKFYRQLAVAEENLRRIQKLAEQKVTFNLNLK